MSSTFPPRVFDRRFTSPVCTVLFSLTAVFLAAMSPLSVSSLGAQSTSVADESTPAMNHEIEHRTFPGILLPGRSALLKSEYDGVLTGVEVLLGAEVRKGQLLCQLAADEERIERDRAEVLLERAKVDLERKRHLHSKGGASDEALEAAQTAHSLAKADLDLARIRLEEHYIRAPFSGVVAERYVDPGGSVEAGDPLVRVTALNPLRLEALLPETMLPAFSRPTIIKLSTAFPDTTIDVLIDLGTIVVDPASGTFPLQIEVDNSEGRLVSGVSCVVAIPAAPKGSP
jgi:multidrug efflux system membrane fusion protein